ncbi:HAD-IIB family hydrolase [Bacillus sp. T3]|uniref:HAD family hydrolase n=1 Tax=Bacillus sp. T3 TaxID=467262 RepID=UPI002981FCDB|nr:HAD-IIB family hydrolase [Bacillus sp. T3]
MIKCIASDMDGTLLTGNANISEKNIQAIKQAQENGVEFVVATGRSFQEAQFALVQAGISCPVICVNGAEVRSADGEIVASQPLPQELAVQAAEILAYHDVYFEVYTDKGAFTNDIDQAISVMLDVFTSANHQFSEEEVEAFAKERVDSGFVHFLEDYHEIFASNQIYKLLAFSPDLAELSNARERLSQLTELAVSSSR